MSDTETESLMIAQSRNTGAITRGANNLGMVRLGLAMLVIASHSFELISGDWTHGEILYSVFGTLTFGGLAVDGFFLISGYLITRSFCGKRDRPLLFAVHRIARIYPGFLVAFWIAVIVVAQLADSKIPLSFRHALKLSAYAVLLQQPVANDAFPGLHYPQLDGPMWTISYEFCCYIAVFVLGITGLLRRSVVAAIAIVSGVILVSGVDVHLGGRFEEIFSDPESIMRLMFVFSCGSAAYLFRGVIRLRGVPALGAVVIACVSMFFSRTAEVGLTVFGGYALLWLALACRFTPGHRFADRTDLSYGVYLYAWPIQDLIIYWIGPGVSPWTVMAGGTAGSLVLAWISWSLVEKPGRKVVLGAYHWSTHALGTAAS